MKKHIQATAQVQMTVEVSGGAPWDETCTLAQVYDQAARTARETVLSTLQRGGQGQVRIVGEPKVIGFVTEKD